LLPIGLLMREHRLIERMIKLMTVELSRISETNKVDSNFIDIAIDFLRTYADRCHHGKEADILFRDLAKKKMSVDHNRIMQELIQEHVYARKTVGDLEKAKESHSKGDVEALNDILKLIKDLVELYSKHIEKEDKRFFFPCMEYLTKQEQESMVQEFLDFDRRMIHEKYEKIVDGIEKVHYKSFAKWKCVVCGYIYDPERGDPENGIPPGIPFEDLPENWVCPTCGATKKDFEKVE